MTTLRDANYDARKYVICAPHDGSKGIYFFSFADKFLNGLAMYDLRDANQDYDLCETALGTDDNGNYTPPGANAPIPLPGPGTAAGKRRYKRIKILYALIYIHIENAEIKKMLSNEVYNDGVGAWTLIKRECDLPITELELEDMKQAVRDLVIISSVGYNKHSVSQFRRKLSDLNSTIPDPNDRLPENDLCLTLLKQISASCSSLSAVADTELKAAPAKREHVYPANHPRAGQRSLTAIVAHFEPLWTSAVDRGTIPLRAPSGEKSAVATMRADVDACAACEDDGYDTVPSGGEDDPGLTLAMIADILKKNSVDISEIVCWNCKGIGHPKSKCPSERRDRSYASVIATLSRLNTSGSAGPAGPSRRPPPRGTRPSFRPAPRLSAKPGVTAYLMEDGSFVMPEEDSAEAADANADVADVMPPVSEEYASAHSVHTEYDCSWIEDITSDPSGNHAVAMHASALEHGRANNGAGKQEPFAHMESPASRAAHYRARFLEISRARAEEKANRYAGTLGGPPTYIAEFSDDCWEGSPAPAPVQTVAPPAPLTPAVGFGTGRLSPLPADPEPPSPIVVLIKPPKEFVAPGRVFSDVNGYGSMNAQLAWRSAHIQRVTARLQQMHAADTKRLLKKPLRRRVHITGKPTTTLRGSPVHASVLDLDEKANNRARMQSHLLDDSMLGKILSRM